MSYAPILGNPKPQFLDENGVPYASGTLTTYEAGTVTLLASQTTSAGTADNSNPLTLDSHGEPAIGFFGANGTGYKVVLKDSGGTTIWTQDNIYPGNGGDDEWINPLTATRTSTTTFTVTGDQTADFHADRRVKCTGGSDRYATIVSSAYTTLTTVTVDADDIFDSSNAVQTLHASMDTVYLHVIEGNKDSSISDNVIRSKRTDTNAVAFTMHHFNENRLINVKTDFGAIGDGITDDRSALYNADQAGPILIPNGTYKVSSALTFTNPVVFAPNAKIVPDNGITVTFQDGITAGDWIVFDGSNSGLFDLTECPTTLRLTQFSGTYANDKWDNVVSWVCGTGQANSYSFIIPRPCTNYDATAVITINSRNYWALDATLNFTNDTSEGTIYIESAFYAADGATVGTGIRIGDSSKVNNLTIHGDLIMHGNNSNTLTNAVWIDSVARLTINGTINAQEADYCVLFGGASLSGNMGAILIDQIHAYSYKYQGIRFSGVGSYRLTGCTINMCVVSSPHTTTTNVDYCIEFNGGVNGVTINTLHVGSAGAGFEDIKGGLSFVGDSTITADGGRVRDIFIANYKADTLDNLLLSATGDSAAASVQGITIGNLISESSGTSPGADTRDINIDYAYRFKILNYQDLGQTVTIGANCGRVHIDSLDNNGITLANSGPKTFFNGLGSEAAGAATAPNTANWQIGDTVHNTSDDSVWRKVKHTGTSATDFIQLG